jgi:hypothetical protein
MGSCVWASYIYTCPIQMQDNLPAAAAVCHMQAKAAGSWARSNGELGPCECGCTRRSVPQGAAGCARGGFRAGTPDA